jgi:hypothetical protein
MCKSFNGMLRLFFQTMMIKVIEKKKKKTFSCYKHAMRCTWPEGGWARRCNKSDGWGVEVEHWKKKKHLFFF